MAPKPPTDARKKKLAQRLRDNLQKRKAQARARKHSDGADKPPPAPERRP